MAKTLVEEVGKCQNIYYQKGFKCEEAAIFTRITKNCHPKYWEEAFSNKVIAKAFYILYPYMRTADCLFQNHTNYDLVMLDLHFMMSCQTLNKIKIEP